jgi:hypothetical protein
VVVLQRPQAQFLVAEILRLKVADDVEETMAVGGWRWFL